MKQIYFSAVFLFPVLVVNAQLKEGKIVYERSGQIKVVSNNPVFENMAKKAKKNRFELSFANNQTLWKILGEDNSSWISPDEKTRLTIMKAEGIPVIYHNLTLKRRIEQRELAEKKYLIRDSIPNMNWKISAETKSMLGHNCQKATSQTIYQPEKMSSQKEGLSTENASDTLSMVAWFAKDIPVSGGPDTCQGQLPGMILELDINNGETNYKAISISPTVEIASINEPKAGKDITRQEYQKKLQIILRNMSQTEGRVFKQKNGD